VIDPRRESLEDLERLENSKMSETVSFRRNISRKPIPPCRQTSHQAEWFQGIRDPLQPYSNNDLSDYQSRYRDERHATGRLIPLLRSGSPAGDHSYLLDLWARGASNYPDLKRGRIAASREVTAGAALLVEDKGSGTKP